MNFPTWVYHKEKMPEGLIVKSEDEYQKLGKGWVDSPAKFEEKKEIEVNESVQIDVSEIAEKPKRKKVKGK